jgi:Fe2+ or Zn2+ uptake regulation protein
VVAHSVEEIIDALRAEGLRATVQRRIVIGALLAGPRHITAEDLAAVVQAEHPDIAQSTIYRILEALERQGLVHHAHLGHGPAVYHLGDDEHLHLVCESCSKVTEVPRAAYAKFARMLADDFDFSVAPHHFAVQGRCSTCEGEPARRHAGNEARAGRGAQEVRGRPTPRGRRSA